jgi:hypothetical protein
MSFKLLREYLECFLSEAPVPLRKPTTPEQKRAFLGLVKWASPKMGAPESMVKSAVDKANSGDWSEAIELIRDYYVLKGIKFKDVA